MVKLYNFARFARAKLVFVVLYFLSQVAMYTSNSDDLPCSDVKYAYTAKGFDDGDVPSEAIPGEHLRICEQSLTCCTEEMEHKLSTHSRAEFDRLLQNTVIELGNTFDSQTQKFDEFFRELLKLSKENFHDMFNKTYGKMYEANAYIFNGMFEDLEKYYTTGGVVLTDSLDNFFHRIYRKVFEMLNIQYTFGEKYLSCISLYMDDLKPFGDVPPKLIAEIKRSFTATKTFVQALAVGRDVIKKCAMEVGPTPECSRALMKMTYCPHCHGLPDLKPCTNYCLNVMTGCLAYHAELAEEWNRYIDSLMMLATRLESSFNIESVLEPINIKVSEAIMNFQENGISVSQKLFEKCGTPNLVKRSIKHELKHETLKFNYQHMVRPTTAAGTSIDRLVQGIKKKMKKAKKFWVQLPEVMCSNPQIMEEQSQKDDCWDGAGKARNGANITGSGAVVLRELSGGLNSHRQNSIINEQVLTLKLITTKLNDAYNGLDVEWDDSDISSGSGSGSGYGGYGSYGSYNEDAEPDGHEDIYFSVPSSTQRTPPPSHPGITGYSSASVQLSSSIAFITAAVSYFVSW